MKDKPEGAVSAFTLIEVLVILVVIGLVVCLLALPRPHTERRVYCPNNLKQIAIAFQTWALDHNDRWPMQVSTNQGGTKELVGTTNVFVHFLVMSNDLNTPKVLVCPEDNRRTAAQSFSSNFNNSTISYFLGVDVMNTNGSINGSMLLCGDRNLSFGKTAKPGFLLLTKDSPVHWTSEVHNRKGCLLFSDGHVTPVYNEDIQAVLRVCNTTNRLVLP